MRNEIIVRSIAQISVQKPLCDEWMNAPEALTGKMMLSQEADYSRFIPPMEGRRMGKMLKRAIATSTTCLQESGTEHPDAIVTGTGLGCVQHSEAVLKELCFNGDDSVKPTNFMQSTHNTISSVIGIRSGSHGYNCTYSQEGLSFENALADAVTQMRNKRISNALVNSFDEMTPNYYTILEKSGYLGAPGECPSGEAAVSVFLDKAGIRNGACVQNAACQEAPEEGLCTLKGIKLRWCQGDGAEKRLKEELDGLLSEAGVSLKDINLVMTGVNGGEDNDTVYQRLCPALFGDIPTGGYKHIFGECLSASALGFYAAAACLRDGAIPGCICPGLEGIRPRNIVLFNHFDGKDFSLALLGKTVCGD